MVRWLPVGAEVLPGRRGVGFRVWAPDRERVEVVIEDSLAGTEDKKAFDLSPEPLGYFSGVVADVSDGDLYRYRLDEGDLFPDPASRFQPHGPHGPSEVIDPSGFSWTDGRWHGNGLKGQVIYEMHIGTFTREGTWEMAMKELPELADLGITVIELMPVAEFPGSFGWGYDGVDLFAPTRLYGRPDEMRRFVDTAHFHGICVILDVVYNHLGPDGNYLEQFSKDYFTDRYETDWGTPINFDGKRSGPVREFFLANAGYWIDEFHLDGLRIDATQNIYDGSKDHILKALTRKIRDTAEFRTKIIIAENEPQEVKLVLPLEEDGYGMDALWNDDFHHSAMVVLTGRNEAYYTDYLGKPQEFISAAKWGYLYQGQYYKWQKKRRGTPTFGIAPESFVTFIQNHDQIANSGKGLRCHVMSGPGLYRAMTALMLLSPGTPMLFQGQEFASSSPFLYFADHKPEIARATHDGRKKFLSQFRSLATPEMQDAVPEPQDRMNFTASKLDFSERQSHAEIYALHRDLLRLRRDDPAFSAQRQGCMDGAVLSQDAFVLRFFSQWGDRLLIVNFGIDLHLDPAPEPLLAPPRGGCWKALWSSSDPRYGGCGSPQLDTDENWKIPGRAAVVLGPGLDGGLKR